MSGSAAPGDLHSPVHPVRFVTAAALFDGHDAAINIMRRILQAQGAEVIHLGHDRSVREVVDAILEEDAEGVAISSYQGGHVEYFEYLAQLLRESGAGHVRVFGGGGGVIVPDEITRLSQAGVRIFAPEDGQRLGLPGMINELIRHCDTDQAAAPPPADAVLAGERRALARAITCLQEGRLPDADLAALNEAATTRRIPVLGITGTGGSGKSSLTDELVRRLRTDQQDKLRVAVLAVDPTRRRGGGALLGDRIRMNALDGDHVFFRSLATRGGQGGRGGELPDGIEDIITACQAAWYDLVILETPGIGQGDGAVTGLADVSLYVMTPEFGAASQLEKIDMLDFADVVAVNKFERRGGADAVRDVARQLIRNREAFGVSPGDMPVFGTSAATFNDTGVTALYQHLAGLLSGHGLPLAPGVLPAVSGKTSADAASIIPPAKAGYLAEIAGSVRGYHDKTAEQAAAARLVQQLTAVHAELSEESERERLTAAGPASPESADDAGTAEHAVAALLAAARGEVTEDSSALIDGWPAVVASCSGDEQVVRVRDKELRTRL
ncbi:MAG: cobalamin-dependent protein, partial [Streptosporangiaceae bacterium]